MRIEKINNQFVIARGDEYRPQYFSFYVDRYRSSWSKFSAQARKHETKADAEETLQRLRRRQREQRESHWSHQVHAEGVTSAS